jgi:hypothetical protein
VEELRRRVREAGELFDDFESMSPYWGYRRDNFAGFEHEGSVLRLWVGPTEALYYSNAELSDGEFDNLPWVRKTFEAKVRLSGLHYGSADGVSGTTRWFSTRACPSGSST